MAMAESLIGIVLSARHGRSVVVNLAAQVGAQRIVCYESFWQMDQNSRQILGGILEQQALINRNIFGIHNQHSRIRDRAS